MAPRVFERTHLIATVVFFAGYLVAYGYAVSGLRPPPGDPDALRPELLVTALFMAAGGLGHACFLMGWRRAVLFGGLVGGISFAAHVALVHAGYSGGLHFTGVLGPRLLGVPLALPLMWLMMTYPAHVMANLTLGGGLTFTKLEPWQLIWLSLITAGIFAAWSLSREPTMVNGFGAWSWGVPGPYFGVPYNQIGLWFSLTFATIGLYRVLELRVRLVPMGETTAFVGLLPVLVYALSGVLDVLGGEPRAVRILVPFAMGIPVILAVDGLLDRVAAWRALAEILADRRRGSGRSGAVR